MSVTDILIRPGQRVLFEVDGKAIEIGQHDNGDISIFAERGALTLRNLAQNRFVIRLESHQQDFSERQQIQLKAAELKKEH